MTAVASNLQRISRILPKQLNLDNSWQHIGNFYIKVLHALSTSAGLIQNIYNLVPYLQPGVPIYNLVPYLQPSPLFTIRCPIYNLVPYLQPGVPFTTQSLIYNHMSHLQPSPLFTTRLAIYNQMSPICNHDFDPIRGSSPSTQSLLFTTRHPPLKKESLIYNQVAKIRCQKSFQRSRDHFLPMGQIYKSETCLKDGIFHMLLD